MVVKDYLLDTTIVGYLEKMKSGCTTPRCEKLRNHIDSLPDEVKLLFCSITVGEIEYGIKIAPKNVKLDLLSVSAYLGGELIFSVDSEVAKNSYSLLRARLFNKYAPRKGKKKKRLEEWKNPTNGKELQIQENDLWIASVAMTFNLTLVTHDKMTAIKDVAGTDIQFEDWIE